MAVSPDQHEPGSARHSGQEIINVKRAREEPSLKEVSSRTFTEVDTSSISLVGLANSLGKAMPMERDDNQVDVVCHQTPCQELDAVSPALLSKQVEVANSPELTPELTILRYSLQLSAISLRSVALHVRRSLAGDSSCFSTILMVG